LARLFSNKYLSKSKVSVKRRDLIKYLEQNGFYLLREGARHSIYTNNQKTIPIKRHQIIDRITANELCKQAGLKPKF
jgi:mRNA interferase HicA